MMRIFVVLALWTAGACFHLLRAADGAKPASAQQPGFVVLPAATPEPDDNLTTPAKVQLGKQLFFDPRLSGSNEMSCATCHLPEKALTDERPRAIGAGGMELARNTPTLWNIGLQTTFFWDGRAASLEEQALIPIQSPDEMAQNLDELVAELGAIPGYVAQFEAVFERPVNGTDIARAIAAFQRTLLTPNSPFDRYLAGDKSALSADAKLGMDVFQRDGCIRCHNGPLLSDGKFYRLSAGGDLGRGQATGDPLERYKFRTPSLRNIAETKPYMHDGSARTLFDAVAFYFRHTPPSGPDALPVDIEPLLGQSYSEIDAVVEFLRSLTGEMAVVERPNLP